MQVGQRISLPANSSPEESIVRQTVQLKQIIPGGVAYPREAAPSKQT
jgi:hypothetical protein